MLITFWGFKKIPKPRNNLHLLTQLATFLPNCGNFRVCVVPWTHWTCPAHTLKMATA